MGPPERGQFRMPDYKSGSVISCGTSLAGLSPLRSTAVPGRHLAAATLTSMVVGAVYGRIAWGMFVRFDDFSDHLRIARHLYETGRPTVPHFLFHGVTAAVYAVPGMPSILVAGALTTIAAYCLTAGATYAIYWKEFRTSHPAAPGLIGLLSLATLVAQPITFAETYTLGYLWPEPYHSPTYAMLKPFALAGFASTAWLLARRQGDAGLVALCVVVTMASALSKPNFAICLLPATALLMAHRLWARQPVATRALIAGVYTPTAAVLAWQFIIAFSGVDGAGEAYRDSVSWAPLKFMNFWATDLSAKFVASVLFPLTVTLLYWPLARRDTLLQFAWLCFGFGVLYSYAVVETSKWNAGNFVWSGYITLLTLLIATIIFWLRQAMSPSGRWPAVRALTCGGVLALHVVSGARLSWLYVTHYGCNVDLRLAQYICD
jgi:hypothetical protein